MTPSAVLEVRDLCVDLQAGGGSVFRIVDRLSLSVAEGETVGIVGESGSGKSVTAQALIGLLPAPIVQTSGEVWLRGKRVDGSDDATWRSIRGRIAGMVFQDSMSAFNPVRTIGAQLVESVRRHRGVSKEAARTEATNALRDVGIPDPAARFDAYPHQLSGGLRQRCMIALALINDPSLLIADEPTTALDATVQRQIVDLLRGRVRGRATILITHDLGLAAELCQTVAMMYRGRIVEYAPTSALLSKPRHRYTEALLALAPRFDPQRRRLDPIPGAPPSVTALVEGCAFRTRCRHASEACEQSPNLQLGADSAGLHRFACWNPA